MPIGIYTHHKNQGFQKGNILGKSNNKTIAERFWSHVNKTGYCWEWKGTITKHGYGQFTFYENDIRYRKAAHRFSWFLIYGYYSKICICHKCDNRKCVNPKHLFEGTYKDNVQDMIKKGRYVCNGYLNKKITDKQIKEICKKYQLGKYSYRSLAKEYECSFSGIRHIVKRNNNFSLPH